jgi:RNA polymerase sigma-70 factor (ECF subfamily)
VLQETLWIIVRRLPSLRDARWFKAWSYRIATREAIHRTHSEERWKEALRGEAMNELPSEEFNDRIDPELVSQLHSELSELSPASQVVLRMHYLDELTHVEIAEALEISEGTVKSRLAYGLAALRRRTALLYAKD